MVCKDISELILQLKIEMVKKDMNISDLALKIGMSRQSLYQVFKLSNPRLSTLYQICNALDLDISISPRDTE